MVRDPVVSDDQAWWHRCRRGGGWWFPTGSSSAIQRDLGRPRECGHDVGFRVVCGPAQRRGGLRYNGDEG
jgi:hypothetical protein